MRFSYFAYSLDPAPTASATVNVNVRAGVGLRINRRQVSNGESVLFRGKLRGKRGRAGTVATIYALGRHGRDRVPVEAVRADRRGRFKYRYRFRSTQRLTVYRFQAVVKRQTGYPYAAGKSRTVQLVVTP